MTIVPADLLDPKVIDDPYPFYCQLRAQAPVWEIPGTGLFTVRTFELVVEATGRVEDFSSNIGCLLYRDGAGLPCRLSYGTLAYRRLPPPIRPCTRCTAAPSSPSWSPSA
jgi:hypothetical protein